jgi:hypothetical protein
MIDCTAELILQGLALWNNKKVDPRGLQIIEPTQNAGEFPKKRLISP